MTTQSDGFLFALKCKIGGLTFDSEINLTAVELTRPWMVETRTRHPCYRAFNKKRTPLVRVNK